MRLLMIGLFAMVVAGPAAAQDSAGRCAPAPGGQVEVETAGQGTLVGTLHWLGETEVSILRQGERMAVPLSQVIRIRKPADPMWDGALKGAAVVLTIWGVSCGFCGAGESAPWRAVAGWAVIGATL